VITAEQLKELHIDDDWLEPLTAAFNRFDINTPERQAAFIGQCAHESGGFKTLQENLNYSAKGLHATWPSRFASEADAQPFHRNPEKIANKVYSGRMGNTDEGDGWKYRGRGLIQLTGKDNYRLASDALDVDFVANPELVLEQARPEQRGRRQRLHRDDKEDQRWDNWACRQGCAHQHCPQRLNRVKKLPWPLSQSSLLEALRPKCPRAFFLTLPLRWRATALCLMVLCSPLRALVPQLLR
jgi:putative chitinase